MNQEPIRTGIVGLGRSGWGIHALGLAEVPDKYRVVAVADAMEDRRDEAVEKFGCAAYPTPEGLIASDDVELVIVAAPSHLHADLAREALGSGKHVVVEKPIAHTVEEIDTLIDTAEQAGRIVTAFHQRRLDPSLLAIKEIVDSGRIGELVLVRRAVHRFQRRSDWQTLRSHNGGELPNTAVHFLDQLLTFVPEDTELDIFADLRLVNSAGDAEDHVKVTIKPAQGPVLDLESTMVVALPQDPWFVVGSQGTISGTETELTVSSTDLSVLPRLEASDATPEGRRYGTGETHEWQSETITLPPAGVPRVTGYYERLYASIRDGAPLFVTPQSARRTTQATVRARAHAQFM